MPNAKPYELFIPSLPLSLFTFDRKAGTLTAFCSDFGPAKNGAWWLDRLYSDSCDLGIVVESEKTGRLERFAMSEELRSADGEVQGWVFSPVGKVPAVKTVTIFND